MRLHACLLLCLSSLGRAEIVDYTLTIAETTVAPAGKSVRALTVNGAVPGTTLRFKEGDIARIRVINGLKDQEVSTHWHGLLLPNLEDGVPYLTTPPILPGQSRTFQFRLKQAGTYWYHSHTGLQEQRAVHGGIVIEPRGAPRVKADKEALLVLSDWTNDKPSEIVRQLMSASDWPAIKKGSAQSILGAAKAGFLKQYFQREKSRMPPMDLSDVAYDAFLINGKTVSKIDVKPGERIRLRVVNAAAASYFYLNSAAGPLTIVASDGMDVRPIQQRRLLVGMAETYDLLFTVPGTGAWEFRATAQDGSGKASVFIGNGAPKLAPDIPRANPYDMNASMGAMLDQMEEPGHLSDAQALAHESPRPLPPYKRLHAPEPTTLPKKAPVRRILLRLSGDMTRYLWTINGATLSEDSVIPVRRGEVLQMELRNDSMMHHPMHLHGHFFRLLMKDGPNPVYAPLKHTVDVPPMSTRIIEFHANEEKDWAFHCHLLYHMHAGMMKVVSYDNQGPNHRPNLGHHGESEKHFLLNGNIQSQMTQGYARMMTERNDFGVNWTAGWGRLDNLKHAPEVEYEIDLAWKRYINPRWMSVAGFRFTNMMSDDENTAFAGATYRLPYFFDLTGTVEHNGDIRVGLAKNFQITSRLSLFGQAQYDTAQNWMWNGGAHYTLTKNFGVMASYDSDYGFGAGFSFAF